MRILVVADQFPYPPTHGGRVDIWTKLIGFNLLQIDVFLVTWEQIQKGDMPSGQDLIKTKSVVNKIRVYPIQRTINRIINLLKYPSLVAGRMLNQDTFESLLNEVKDFDPKFVFIDGLYGFELGRNLAKAIGIAAALRLHNVEWLYMQGQFRLEKTIRGKVSIFLAQLHLKKYEHRATENADSFYDISFDDLNLRKQMGYNHGYWLPPIVITQEFDDPIGLQPVANFDLCYFGNLYTPNNVAALKWFLGEVFPLIVSEFPNASIIIAGSKPSDELVALIEAQTNVTLHANPIELGSVVQQANAFINPIQFGSGVNIKSIEMLFYMKPIVTTSIGVQGLPPEVKECFFIRDKAEQFAEIICKILSNEVHIDNEKRIAARKFFQIDILKSLIKFMALSRN